MRGILFAKDWVKEAGKGGRGKLVESQGSVGPGTRTK